MTETSEDPSLPPPKAPRSGSRLIVFLLFLLVIAAGIAAAIYWLPMQESRLWPMASGDSSWRPRLGALEEKVAALDKRVDDINERINGIAAARAPSTPQAGELAVSKTATAEFARMQSDLVALSAAVSALQAEVKQAGNTASSIRAQTQAALAETVAYMQLRAQAESGHSFKDAFTALQTAAANDPAFKEPLTKLAPYADKGAPSIAALREQLLGLTRAVERAMAKAEAQNWWERILAELKGLVSIRPLHGSETPEGGLGLMQTDLERDDLSAALDEMKNLPPEAQKTLDDWRTNAEARRTIDQSLRMMADDLIAGPPAPSAPPAQEAP